VTGDPRRFLLRHAAVQTGLWILLAAFVVHLSSAVHVRLDLTRDGRYGLSSVTIDTVSHLERPLVARVFFSEGLAAPYHDHRRALLDLLEEMAAHAGGRMEVVAVDPAGDPQIRADAERLGIRPLPYAYRDWDRTEARTVFMGLALLYGDEKVTVDALPSIERMEVEVVSAVRRLVTPVEERTTVAWLLGHGEPDPASFPPEHPLQVLARRLGDGGSFRTIAPGDAPIPDDVDVVVIVAPRAPIPAAELVQLDQLVMRGGGALAFVSTAQPDLSHGRVVEVPHGLAAWLGGYGIVLGRSVLLDRTHNERLDVPITLSAGGTRMVRVNHPLAVVTTNLDRLERPVRDLPRLVLPFASPVGLADPLPDGVEGAVWARTEDTASALRRLPPLSPNAYVTGTLEGEVGGAQGVVAAVSGTFPSAFAGRQLPPRLDPEASPFDPTTLKAVSAEPTRLVVVGSGDAVANNVDLALAAVDWIVEDPALLELRSRLVADPPLAPPPRATALRLKAAMVGLPLFVVFLLGLAGRRRA
jgi:hypothetical protein